MKEKWIHLACLLAGVAAWNGAIAYGQTDVAASIDGAVSGATQSGTPLSGEYSQSSSNSAGALLEMRHIHNSWVGFEAAYSYNRANQTYTYIFPANAPTTPCPSSGCNSQPVTVVVSAYAQTITGDWVISRKKRNLQYFALAGGGVLFVVPSSGQIYTSSATEFVFECGLGLDWKFASHFGLRLQDRVDIDSAPNLNTFSTVNGDLTYTQEPALGVYYRF